MGTRAANNRSSVFQSTDGRWYGFVTMGTKPDGSAERRERSGRTQAEVARKVRVLERLRDENAKVAAGRSPRLADWLEDWLTSSALRVRRGDGSSAAARTTADHPPERRRTGPPLPSLVACPDPTGTTWRSRPVLQCWQRSRPALTTRA